MIFPFELKAYQSGKCICGMGDNCKKLQSAFCDVKDIRGQVIKLPNVSSTSRKKIRKRLLSSGWNALLIIGKPLVIKIFLILVIKQIREINPLHQGHERSLTFRTSSRPKLKKFRDFVLFIFNQSLSRNTVPRSQKQYQNPTLSCLDFSTRMEALFTPRQILFLMRKASNALCYFFPFTHWRRLFLIWKKYKKLRRWIQR